MGPLEEIPQFAKLNKRGKLTKLYIASQDKFLKKFSDIKTEYLIKNSIGAGIFKENNR